MARKRWWPRVTDEVSLASSSGPTVASCRRRRPGADLLHLAPPISGHRGPRASAPADRRVSARSPPDPRARLLRFRRGLAPTPRPEGFGADSATRTRMLLPTPEGADPSFRTHQVPGSALPPNPPSAARPSKAGPFLRGLPARCSSRSVRPGEGHLAPPTEPGSSTFSSSPGLSPNLLRSPQVHPSDAQRRAQSIHSASPDERLRTRRRGCAGRRAAPLGDRS